MGRIAILPFVKSVLLIGIAEAVSTTATSVCFFGMCWSKTVTIILTVILCVVTAIFAYMASRPMDNRFMRIVAITGTVVWPVAAICIICVDSRIVHLSSGHTAVLSPLYMFIAASILYAFGIVIKYGVAWARCWTFRERLLTTNHQVLMLLATNSTLGCVQGLVYGLVKPETNHVTDSMIVVLVVFTVLGFATGAVFGGVNDYHTQRLEWIGLDPTIDRSDYKVV